METLPVLLALYTLTGGLPSRRARNAEFLGLSCYYLEQAIEQAIELPMIWDASHSGHVTSL